MYLGSLILDGIMILLPREVECEGVGWIHLAKGRLQWWTRVNQLTNFRNSWSRVLLEKAIVTQLVKKFPCLYNPKVHYHVYYDLYWVRWIQSTSFYHISSKIDFNIIHLPMARSFKWHLPFRFSDQNFACIFHLSNAYYMTCPCHPPWFDHSNNTFILYSNKYSISGMKKLLPYYKKKPQQLQLLTKNERKSLLIILLPTPPPVDHH